MSICVLSLTSFTKTSAFLFLLLCLHHRLQCTGTYIWNFPSPLSCGIRYHSSITTSKVLLHSCECHHFYQSGCRLCRLRCYFCSLFVILVKSIVASLVVCLAGVIVDIVVSIAVVEFFVILHIFASMAVDFVVQVPCSAKIRPQPRLLLSTKSIYQFKYMA